MEVPLTLASLSPRREQLLKLIGYPFQVEGSGIEEEVIPESPPRGVELLALEKARAVAGRIPEGLVLGADTVVELDGNLMGKPADVTEARKMIEKLSGRKHRVYTGLALVDASDNRLETIEHETTLVSFSRIGEDELQNYLQSGDWSGKAGAYAIQGKAGILVERLEGCYFNVVGLPLHLTYRILSRRGLDVSAYWRKGDG